MAATESLTPAAALAALITHAAEAEILSKAVFSKPRDKTVSRVTLTLKRVKGETVLQRETLRVADVADTEVNGKKACSGLPGKYPPPRRPRRPVRFSGGF